MREGGEDGVRGSCNGMQEWDGKRLRVTLALRSVESKRIGSVVLWFAIEINDDDTKGKSGW